MTWNPDWRCERCDEWARESIVSGKSWLNACRSRDARIAALEAGVRRLRAAMEHGRSRSTLFQICEEVLDTRAALAPAPAPGGGR